MTKAKALAHPPFPSQGVLSGEAPQTRPLAQGCISVESVALPHAVSFQKVPGQHSELARDVGQAKVWFFRTTRSPYPTGYVGSKSHSGRAGSAALSLPQTQALPHGAYEEAQRKVGRLAEGSNLPLTRSSAAQKISCYFWGPPRA